MYFDPWCAHCCDAKFIFDDESITCTCFERRRERVIYIFHDEKVLASLCLYFYLASPPAEADVSGVLAAGTQQANARGPVQATPITFHFTYRRQR